ncbi:MAG TPA: hypothetical protein PKK15_11785, partial [Kouleothrix sp.]|nr:hypothetical protein [Kouleothrix sp.]
SWLIDAEGHTLHEDLFAPETWQRYRWGVYDPAVEARLLGPGGPQASARLAALRAARAALYAEAADARIDTEARSAEEVAERVLLAGGITVVSDLS